MSRRARLAGCRHVGGGLLESEGDHLVAGLPDVDPDDHVPVAALGTTRYVGIVATGRRIRPLRPATHQDWADQGDDGRCRPILCVHEVQGRAPQQRLAGRPFGGGEAFGRAVQANRHVESHDADLPGGLLCGVPSPVAAPGGHGHSLPVSRSPGSRSRGRGAPGGTGRFLAAGRHSFLPVRVRGEAACPARPDIQDHWPFPGPLRPSRATARAMPP